MRFSIKFLCLFLFISFLSSQSYAGKTELLPDTVGIDSIRNFKFTNKSPMGALLRSAVFPGWGQLYNRKYLKATLIFGAETTFLILMAIEWDRMNQHKKLFDSLPLGDDKNWEYEQYEFYKDRKNLFLWSALATIFISMFDAYVDAHLYTFDKEMDRIGIEIEPRFEEEISLKLSFNF